MAGAVVLLAGCGGAGPEHAKAPASTTCWGVPGYGPGQLVKPRAIAAAGGRLFVADLSNRIQIFDLDGHWQASWKLADVSHGYPTGLDVGPDGRLAVADTHNHRVLFYSRDGEPAGVLGGDGGGPGEFTYVTDVKFDSAGDLYVSEHGREDRIQKFDAAGRFLVAWGRAGEQPGEFHRPQALAVGRDGAVYVADAANHRVQKFSPEGEFVAAWGKPGRAPGELLYPYGLAVTAGNLLAVSEYGNNRIQFFDADGRSVRVVGGPGRKPGELASPRGIAWVEGRGVYVADMENYRVQLFAEF